LKEREKIAETVFIVRKRRTTKGAENVFFCPLLMENAVFSAMLLAKAIKKAR